MQIVAQLLKGYDQTECESMNGILSMLATVRGVSRVLIHQGCRWCHLCFHSFTEVQKKT